MSLQRVFESARKMGIPVIVTDPSGRDPMVVLPLEQFEAMAGDSRPTPVVSKPMPVPKQSNVQNSEDIRMDDIPGLSKEARESFDAIAVDTPEISLEERFYFEPVDDERTG